MKEYKGSGTKLVIDGDKLTFKQVFLKEREFSFSDIEEVRFTPAKKFISGSVKLLANKRMCTIIFTEEQESEFKELYELIEEKISVFNEKKSLSEEEKISGVNDKKSLSKEEKMKTAEGMYEYCLKNDYALGKKNGLGLGNFRVIERQLNSNEDVLMAFIAVHNFTGLANNDSEFAYAITNKRLILARDKFIGEIVQSIDLESIMGVTMNNGVIWGTITIDSLNEKLNVGVHRYVTKNINQKIHEVLEIAKNYNINTVQKNNNLNTGSSDADEILKFKNLLDMGAISEEEFNLKKKQLLGI